jgi:hypothetical protein
MLAMASESRERGTILPCPRAGLVAALRTTSSALDEALVLFTDLEMAYECEDGAIVVTHFLSRQYDSPSDMPEATRERKRRARGGHDPEPSELPGEASDDDCGHDNVTTSHADVTTSARPVTTGHANVTNESRSRVDPDTDPEAARCARSACATKTRKPWKWREQLGALLEVCEVHDTSQFTNPEWGKWRSAAKQLGEAGHDREAILLMSRHWPNLYGPTIRKRPTTFAANAGALLAATSPPRAANGHASSSSILLPVTEAQCADLERIFGQDSPPLAGHDA